MATLNPCTGASAHISENTGMTANSLSVLTLDQFLAALTHPSALVEGLTVLACLLLAWSVIRVWRGNQAPERSIWFGDRVVDGVLFPLLALVLTLAARRLLLRFGVAPALFQIIVPALVSFALIRLSVRVLSVAFPDSHWMRLIEKTISWVIWLAWLGWITGVVPEVLEELDQVHFQLGKTDVSIRKLIEGTLSAGFLLVLALWASAALESWLLKGAVGEQLSLRKVAANMVRASLLLLGLLLALSAVGIDLTALSVLGGAVGVGIGFGFQKLAANYVSGFVILAERSLRIGDVVKIDQYEGKITDITTRYTVIRAISGREAIVPNEMLITTPVENLSLSDRSSLVTTTVSVAYGTDLDRLLPQIVAAVGQVPRVLTTPKPAALLNAFGADGLDLLVCFWIGDPENGTAGVRSAVNLAVLALLNREGVDIPYPQRVVRVLSGADQPTEVVRSAATRVQGGAEA